MQPEARARTWDAEAGGARPRKVAGQQQAPLVRARPRFARPATARPPRPAMCPRTEAGRFGWQQGAVFGRWPGVVGEQIAAHAIPTALNEEVMTVSAESTAWATQLRMVQAQLLAKIAAAVGDGVVHVSENRGSGGAVVAQRPLSHRRARAPRHVRIAVFRLLAESRDTAGSAVLKRLDAPRSEKFHRRRK